MNTFLSIVLFVGTSLALQAQESPSLPNSNLDTSEEIFTVVEDNPSFPGGVEAMYAYIGKNLNYPKEAKENGIQGRVVVQFVVNLDGSITEVKVLKDIGGGCGDEAVRVVKAMPNWKPGTQKGKAVKVRYNLPFKFELDNGQKEKKKKKKSKSKSSPTDKF
jgi:TonB family protein